MELNGSGRTNSSGGAELSSGATNETQTGETITDGGIILPPGVRDARQGTGQGGTTHGTGGSGSGSSGPTFGRRLGNALSSWGYSRSRRLINGAKSLPKSAGRFIRRTAIGGYGAATLGLAGLAVGAASGDFGNAVKLGTAGAAAGYSFANKYGDSYAKGFVEDLKGAEMSYQGKEMRAKDAERYDNAWMRDARNRDAMTKATGDRSLVREKLKDGTIQEFLNNGQTNPGLIGKGLKIQGFYEKRGYGKQESLQMAIASLNLNRTVSDRVLDPYSREREAFVRRFRQQFAGSGMSDKQIDDRISQIIDDLNEINT